MEHALRTAFCALVGTKFAAVVAGGQSVAWLNGECEALADAHAEMPDDKRQAIKDALSLCKTASERRNILVHGVKTYSREGDGALLTFRSRKNSHVRVVQQWTPAEIGQVGRELSRATSQLYDALKSAVSHETFWLWGALSSEDRERREGTP